MQRRELITLLGARTVCLVTSCQTMHRSLTPTTPITFDSYRPDIDGLRAISILAVIANHLDKQLVPGGYLGVDIFFVISGFVITSSLAQGRNNSFREFLVGFFVRRIRRLAPALLACTLVTGIAVWLLVPAPEDSLRTGIYALFGLSNIQLFLEKLDYFTPSRDLNTFAQTWSLGVEEQFYLLFPFIIWFAGGASGNSCPSRSFAIAMSALSLASLAAFYVLNESNPRAAFFLTPARFWELGTGSLLYSLSQRYKPSELRPVLQSAPLAALLGLLGIVFLSPAEHARSVIAIVFLSAILIFFARQSRPVYTLLANKMSVYIGLISYPLYLWHWSVISLGHWMIGRQSDFIPVQLTAIALLSIATYEYIERPLRISKWQRNYPRAIMCWALCVVLCGISLQALIRTDRILGVASARRASLERQLPDFLPLKGSGQHFNPNCVVDGKDRLLKTDMLELCTVAPKDPDGQTIWTLGDSHAGHLQGLLYAVHDRIGIGVHLIETPGVPFPMLPGAQFEPRNEIYRRISASFRRGDILLVARLFLNRDKTGTPVADLMDWERELVAFSRHLATRGIPLVVVGPPPLFQFADIHACSAATCDILRKDIEGNIHSVLRELDRAAESSGNLYVFDSFGYLCPPDALRCSPLHDGLPIFRDKDHLNAPGAAALATGFIDFLRAHHLISKKL